MRWDESTHQAKGARSRVEERLRGRDADKVEQVGPLGTQHVLHARVDESPRAVRRN